ncbi:MAG: response regulator transcription factor [Comamonadaceae bacterium]|nr:MAG: response regulator transcription factor [Comamonadaceae bacterium]
MTDFSASRPLRIAIADDHSVVLSGLRALFARHDDLLVVASAISGSEALAVVTTQAIDVLVLDVTMPGEGAADVMQRIKVASPATSVVVFSGLPEKTYALPMSRLGARAYVDKASPSATLVDAVRAVARGELFFTEAIPQGGISSEQLSGSATTPDVRLTGREFQIFLRLASGERVRSIAQALGLTDVTISTHRASVLQKLNLKSNAQLTRYALEQRYIN